MAMEIDFEVDAFDEGRRLRDVIRGHKGFSSALWKRIKWNGEVWINGVRIHNAKTVLHEKDRVRLVWDESSDIVPADIPLDILYEDDTLLVVNKGTGMIIHPTNAGIHDTLVNAVAGYFQKKGEKSGIHPVYRLDRNTTGVVVVAKSAKAQYALTRSHDLIHREYIAVAGGYIPGEFGIVDAPIGRKEGSIIEWTVRKDGRPARTEYTVLRHGDNYTVLKLHLLTGRTHQIRVHARYMGTPLLGDDLYGGNHDLIGRQALHAHTVTLTHPETGEAMKFTAPVPADMEPFMNEGKNMHIETKSGVSFLTFDVFKNENLIAAVSTKNGGVSTGAYHSLNMGFSTDDAPEKVRENRKRFFDVLGIIPERLVNCALVHGIHMEKVGKADCGRGAQDFTSAIPACDGLYTNEKNVPLGLNYADCTPLLFYDPVTSSIAVAHGGWRGTAGNIAGEAMRHLQESYGAEPKNIKAGIGPAIGKSVFEVEKDVVEAFEKIFDEEEMKRLSAPKGEGKILIDLPLANRILIERAGILPENIEDCGICTYCRNDLFYSYRKAAGRTGRHMAVMMLK
jgi:conserved hypothetical protein, YfiH family